MLRLDKCITRDLLTVFPPQGSHPEILRYMEMGGLWKVMGVCAQQWGLKQRLKLQSHHGEWQNSEDRSKREALGDVNWGGSQEKIISTCLSTSNPPLPTTHPSPMPWTLTLSSQKPRSSCTWPWKCSNVKIACGLGQKRW